VGKPRQYTVLYRVLATSSVWGYCILEIPGKMVKDAGCDKAKILSQLVSLFPHDINTPDPSIVRFHTFDKGIRMSTHPFRFLNLPPKLRNLIYEYINVATYRLTLRASSSEGIPYTVTLIRRGLPIQLLATCQQIKYEATAILIPKTAGLRNQPLRLFVDLAPTDGPLYTLPGRGPFAYLFGVEKHEPSMPLPPGWRGYSISDGHLACNNSYRYRA
jgi:hypothetical protein